MLLEQMGVPAGQVVEETLIDPGRRMALIASLVGEQAALEIMGGHVGHGHGGAAQAEEARRERQARMASEQPR
jgi:hypothetical protein